MNANKFLVDIVLKQFKDGKGLRPRYITIFGTGQNGLLLLKYLRSSGVTVNYFCDNDSKKQGTMIEGVPCISFDELCQIKNDVVVFVSPFKSSDIIEELEEFNFPHIVPDYLKIARFIPCTEKENSFLFPQYIHFGHYYSLYPDIDEILEKEEKIFDRNKEVMDIDFNEEEQISILNNMTMLYPTLPEWKDIHTEIGATSLRYSYGNLSISPADAIGLHCMLRILKPRKMIEVGSGYSSAVTLDTNEYYLNNQIQLTFIEPYPKLLKSLLKERDQINLIDKGLQEVPLEMFEELESGDILFIDSTHVSKINSDVNYLFFEILPRLKSGVYIHLHDVFYPFEYPKKWIFEGMIWNELYMLRAFLQNNSEYSIVYFQNMMEQKYENVFLEKWPLPGSFHGASIWLKKVGL